MIERLPERIDSKFRFILLAANRAEQLMRGARPRVDIPSTKPTRIAMEEVFEDRVRWDYGPPPMAEEPEVLEGIEGEEEPEQG